ncbi:disulfide bond formation protein B [Ferrimonas pelagia]|uniref:Putative protein-disulfide oxidoreductase DsbI n=1 Tax=Ferrimonas pelagia TaxID=1177826 RepID=A0ABP9ENP8_9GAMM
MELLKSLWANVKAEPVPTLHRWANLRPVWFVMAGAALFLEATAHIYFQWFLAMDPCEKCVYIRYSQFCIMFAGLLIAIKPQNLVLKLIGLYIAWWAILQGMVWSVDLVASHSTMEALDTGMDFFAAGGGANACATEPSFPFGLPLHEWFPTTFAITGVCGEDNWSFLGGSMGHWLVFIYGVKIAVLGTVTIGWLAGFVKPKTASAS